MAVNTGAGSRLYIGTTAALASTDTYTEVAEITNFGEFGRTYDEIKYSSLGNRNVLKFKGQRDDGNIQLDLGRSATDPGQAACVAALDIDLDYNFKITLNDMITPNITSTATITIATPGVVTITGSAPIAGTPVKFSTTGALPTGLTAGTTYYVVAPSGSTFSVAATVGGAAIATTGTQSGVHTAVLSPGAPTTFLMKAKVLQYATTIGPASGAVVAAKIMLGVTSGSISETAAT